MIDPFKLGDIVNLDTDYERYIICPHCHSRATGVAKNNGRDCECVNHHSWHIDNGRVVPGKSPDKPGAGGRDWWSTNEYAPVRQKVVQVSPALLQDIMTQGRTIGDDRVIRCIEGVPEGAKFITGFFDHHTGIFELVFEHESFPVVGAHCRLPIMPVTYQTFYKEWREDV